VEAYYYAQPSMGVVVCPVLFENNTKIVEEYCYYVSDGQEHGADRSSTLRSMLKKGWHQVASNLV
jgi:hypothetical protein